MASTPRDTRASSITSEETTHLRHQLSARPLDHESRDYRCREPISLAGHCHSAGAFTSSMTNGHLVAGVFDCDFHLRTRTPELHGLVHAVAPEQHRFRLAIAGDAHSWPGLRPCRGTAATTQAPEESMFNRRQDLTNYASTTFSSDRTGVTRFEDRESLTWLRAPETYPHRQLRRHGNLAVGP